MSKGFKALSFVWLLFCFFAAHEYAEKSGLEGLFMRIFLYGIFAAPIWLVYGWQYLCGDRPIPKIVFLVLLIAVGVWLANTDSAYRKSPTAEQILIMLTFGYFCILAWPYSFMLEAIEKRRLRKAFSYNRPPA